MKRKPYRIRKRTTTKSVLRPSDFEHAKAAVLNSLTSLDDQATGLLPEPTGARRSRSTLRLGKGKFAAAARHSDVDDHRQKCIAQSIAGNSSWSGVPGNEDQSGWTRVWDPDAGSTCNFGSEGPWPAT
jgi:hypothetical protein